jgi:hypothetical protein
MERLNHPLFATTITNSFAGRHDATLESRIADVLAWP